MDTSYLSQQVTTIIERLHGFFDEIGVPSHERDSRESELFSALSETLHNKLNQVAKEKHDLTEQAQHLVKTIRQLERSLDDSRPKDAFEAEQDGLGVTFPLLNCIQQLREKHHTISKLHRERYEQIQKLVEALESYASHLEPSFLKIKLPPTGSNAEIPPTFDLSPTYVAKVDAEFTRVYEEYNRRLAYMSQCASEIISLWSELGTPQAQVDSRIVQHARDAPEQLGLHQEDLKRLTAKRDKLVAEKQQRERKLKDLRATVEALWDRLSVEESERKQFLAANRGCGLRQINEFEDELSRLNELKRQNLHIFVEDARFQLQALWDGLYFSEEEMLDFTPAFSDVYSDALLLAHEQELARLEALKEQRGPILAAVDKYRSLIKDREDLEKSSQDASRLMSKGAKGEKRDPGKLLREEKMRKRITKDLPKVEAELRKTLESWENEYGRPFCILGERYLDELDAGNTKAPPARSKTPNALGHGRDAPAPKSVGRAAPQSQGRSNTVRGAPPPRSKTPTANFGRHHANPSGMMSSNAVTAASSKVSPSKIPGASRLPMSTMRDGNNSPERSPQRNGPPRSHTALGNHDDRNRTIRGAAAPRAPPPKMKDLFIPPTPTPAGNKENGSESERSASLIRHVDPEDPYNDRAGTPRTHPDPYPARGNSSSMMPPPQNSCQRPPSHDQPSHRQQYAPSLTSQDSYTSYSSHSSRPLSQHHPTDTHAAYPMAPPSRQTSNTSSLMSGTSGTSGSHYGTNSSAVSGSENWETYTDTSETEEQDATDAYYAKVKAQQLRQLQQQQHPQQQHQLLSSSGNKRPATAVALPQLGTVKRVREHQAPAALERASFEDDGGRTLMMVDPARDASDGAWTDDMGETF